MARINVHDYIEKNKVPFYAKMHEDQKKAIVVTPGVKLRISPE